MELGQEASWRGIGAFELSFERGREEEQAAARKRVCFLYWGEEVLKLFGDCWRSSFLRGDFLWLGGLDREDSRELQREVSKRESFKGVIQFLVVYDFRFFTFIAIFYLFPDI